MTNHKTQEDFYLLTGGSPDPQNFRFLKSDAEILNLYVNTRIIDPQIAYCILPQGHSTGEEKIIRVVSTTAYSYVQLYTYSDNGTFFPYASGIFDGGVPPQPGTPWNPPTALPSVLNMMQGDTVVLKWSGNRWLIVTATLYGQQWCEGDPSYIGGIGVNAGVQFNDTTANSVTTP